MFENIPKVKVGIVAVSRDCFPESLSVNRRKALVDAYKAKYDPEDIYECPVCIVESEIHMVQALEDIKKEGCNALVVYLGNFGPEISETLLAKHFDGPKMFVAAAEETGNNLVSGRGDAYCGMLNASYNLQLRNIKAYIPEYPVGTAAECVDMIDRFICGKYHPGLLFCSLCRTGGSRCCLGYFYCPGYFCYFSTYISGNAPEKDKL